MKPVVIVETLSVSRLEELFALSIRENLQKIERSE